jgi:hypothetical protein
MGMEREMTMVERVARALSIADGMHPDACSNDEDEPPAWTLYVGSAKAAIDAMREPTEAMKKTMANTPGRWGPHCWGQIVDAALKEHEEGR